MCPAIACLNHTLSITSSIFTVRKLIRRGHRPLRPDSAYRRSPRRASAGSCPFKVVSGSYSATSFGGRFSVDILFTIKRSGLSLSGTLRHRASIQTGDWLAMLSKESCGPCISVLTGCLFILPQHTRRCFAALLFDDGTVVVMLLSWRSELVVFWCMNLGLRLITLKYAPKSLARCINR